MVGLKLGGRSLSGLSSVFPIFRPAAHRGQLVIAAVTYAIAFPASLVPSALLVAMPCLVLYRRSRRRLALALATGFLLANGMEIAGKSLIVKPELSLDRPGLGPIRLDRFDSTFPSGHAARAVFVAAAVSICLPRLRGCLLGWLIAVMISLVVSGAHTPSDIVGGFLLAVVLCVLAREFGDARHSDNG
jgi:membrane-associated phospholipid phosphatase